MAILKHRIDSEQHLINHNFGPVNYWKKKQYYSYPADNISAEWDGNDFLLHRKGSGQVRVCEWDFRIENDFAVKMGWFTKKSNGYIPVEQNCYFRLTSKFRGLTEFQQWFLGSIWLLCKITHKNCLVWCKLGFAIKVVLKNFNFLFWAFGSQCTESNSRLSVQK